MTMPQNLIFQNLPNLCRLDVDSHGFVNLIPMTQDEIQQANPAVNVYQVCTHIDPTGRQIDGNIRYLIEINGMPLYTRRYGKLPDGKQNEHFHLEEMYQNGLLEKPAEGHVHKTNALGVQCARLNLSAIQNLMASKKEPTGARIS